LSYAWSNYAVLPILSGVILLIVGIAAASYRSQRTSGPVFFLASSAMVWCFGYALELCSGNSTTAKFWANFQYLGLVFLGPAILLLGIYYSNAFETPPKWLKYVPYIQAAISLPIIFADTRNQWFRRNLSFNSLNGFGNLEYDKGPWYLINLGLTYLQIIVGVLLIAQLALSKNNLYRKQTRIMLFGVLAPVLGSAAYVCGLSPVEGYDPTPALMGIAGVALAGSVFRWSLFDLAPIARDLVVEQLPMPVLVTAENDRIIDVNEAARRMFGLKSPRMLGQTALTTINRCGKWQDPWFLTDDRTYQLLRYPVTDAMGDNVGAVYQFNDMTEVLAYERELSSAKEYAENASAAKSRFIANVSHEIRTPLNGVIGIAELMQATEMSREQRGYVQAIQGCSRTLLHVVNDILDLSKLEAGKFELERKDTDLRQLVKDVVKGHEATATSRGIDFVYEMANEVPHFVSTDPSKLRQTLNNLVSNAVKFTESGRIAVMVRKVGSRVEFIVEDTGIGISIDKQGRVFDPFQQADASDSRVYGGTGLGLAIVKQTVELFNGTLALESEPGVGTKITILLPLDEIEGKVEQTPEVPDINDTRVLLVEDNNINALVVQRLLERTGCIVVHAEDGFRALDLLQEHNGEFDIVLLDLQMPGLDGYETYRRIAQKWKIPVVALTANANQDDRLRCIRLGMVEFLTKPVAAHDLYKIIKQFRTPAKARTPV
jgi:signal transduction histidine kinase/CheY-like chemotaxis protein